MPTSVAELCRQRNFSIKELTARSGLDDQRVLAIALGRWTPSPAERRSIADALQVSVDELTWGHTTPIQHIYGHGPT